MSNVDESSYYEIALTNRQVMVAFVILLVCVLGAFFGGVWVGKGQPEVASQELPAAEGPAELAAMAEDREEPSEFEFFNRNGERPEPTQRPDLAQIAAEPNPDTTLAQDLGVQPIAAKDPAESEVQAPSTEAPPDWTEPEAEKSAPQTGPTTRDVAGTDSAGTDSKPGDAVPAEPALTEPPAPATDGPVVIQVFSSRDEIQARRLLTRLQAKGFAAQLSPVQVGRDTMYRVRVGPFDERAQAEAVAARVRRELQVDTWITAAE